MKAVTSAWLGWGAMAPTPVAVSAPTAFAYRPCLRVSCTAEHVTG